MRREVSALNTSGRAKAALGSFPEVVAQRRAQRKRVVQPAHQAETARRVGDMRGVAGENNTSDAIGGGGPLMHVVCGVEGEFVLLVTRQNSLDESQNSAHDRFQRLRCLLGESEPPQTFEVDLIDDSSVDRVNQIA